MTREFWFRKKYRIVMLAVLGIALLLFSEFMINGSDNTLQDSETEKIEQKLTDMIETLDGVSRADVIVTLDTYAEGKESPRVRGVAIICHGKCKDDVKIKIIMLVSTALGVTSDKIFVSFA